MSLIAAVLLTLTAGQSQSATTTASTQDADDPMVCEKQEVIGSRLKAKKVCMRRSEWAAQRDQNKQMIERTQVQRPINGGG